MRTTIRQVAERAGVSRTTVSNVLLGRHEEVSPETRDIVLRLVQEMEYIPVRPALQNRHTPSRMISMPVDDPRKLFWDVNSSTYLGVCLAAKEHSYDVSMLMRSDPDWAADGSAVQFLDRRSDGLIFGSPTIGESTQTFEVLVRHRIPVVACYRRDVPEGIAWVDPNNKGAMYGAVEHLVENGHTRIAHLTRKQAREYKTTDFDKFERRRYFLEALQAYGLDVEPEPVFGVEFFEASPELAHQIMACGFTAVVCTNDRMAKDLMKAMHAVGLSIPDDLSLVGVDGIDVEQAGLTSLEFSFEQVGRMAVESLIGIINGKNPSDCCVEIPVQLVQRRSVKNLK